MLALNDLLPSLDVLQMRESPQEANDSDTKLFMGRKSALISFQGLSERTSAFTATVTAAQAVRAVWRSAGRRDQISKTISAFAEASVTDSFGQLVACTW